MKTEQTGHPLELHLPDGQRAQLVPGSRPPRYTVAGELTTIDVTIPDDLAQAGWIWSGSFLYQPWPGQGPGPGVAIATCTFGVPGWPCERKTCFEAAYEMERLRAERAEAKAAAPQKKPRRARKAVDKASALDLLRTTEAGREAVLEQKGMGL